MNKNIINKFIDQFKIKHSNYKIEIVGIFGFGSRFEQKTVYPNSDLDIYLVIKNIGKRFRGITHIDKIEIDYFVNPIEQLKTDWEKVKNGAVVKKTIAYMLKDGKIILDSNNELKNLQAQAKKFLKDELKNNNLTKSTIISVKYFIEDYIKDIEDSLSNNDIFSWQYNTTSLLNYLIEVFCRFHKISLVKQKYQGAEIAKQDKKFVKLYEAIATASSREVKFKKIQNLVLYCLKSFGGKLPEEWEIESFVEVI